MQNVNDKRIATERRIVRKLIRHLKTNGWTVSFVWDGERVPVRTEAEAMEAIFAVDTSHLYFRRTVDGDLYLPHAVVLIGGNGEDIISDWGFSDGDPDGFNAAMDAFLDRLYF